MRSAEARAGEHRDRHFGDHRHVDRYAIALTNAERLQRIRRLLHLAVEVVVGEGTAITRFTNPVNGDLLAEPSGDVAIDAVLRYVQPSVSEPLREGEAPLQRLGEGGAPGEPFARLLRPEGNGVCGGFGVNRGADVGCGRCGGVGREGETRRLKGFDCVV